MTYNVFSGTLNPTQSINHSCSTETYKMLNANKLTETKPKPTLISLRTAHMCVRVIVYNCQTQKLLRGVMTQPSALRRRGTGVLNCGVVRECLWYRDRQITHSSIFSIIPMRWLPSVGAWLQ